MPTIEEWTKFLKAQETPTPIPAPPAQKSTTSNSTPYSQGNNYGTNYSSSSSTPSYTPSNTPAPPAPSAITQQAKPQTNQSGQVQLPSWMGNMYSQVPGTNYYSTNPSNPNSAKYYSDGSPVASMNYHDDKGFSFDGYGTPEIFQKVVNLANVPNGAGLSGVGDVYKSGIASGQLTPNSAIYAPPASSYTKNLTVDAMPIDQQLAYYGAHPQEAEQEIGRAQGVGGAAAQTWINQLRSMVPQPTGQSSSQGNSSVAGTPSAMSTTTNKQEMTMGVSQPLTSVVHAPAQGSQTQGNNNVAVTPTNSIPAPAANTTAANGQMSQDQIKAEAAAKIAQQVAERTRIANQTKSGYNTSYDRLQQQTKDNRTLENAANQRNLNPFSGRTDYAQGMISREREITDRQNQQDLQTRLGSVDTQLSDFLNQTPEMQQQIINDLTRQEREYGLQVGALTGNLNGNRTLAGISQDFNQGMAQKQFGLQQQGQYFNQDLAGKQFGLQSNGQDFNQAIDSKKLDLATKAQDADYTGNYIDSNTAAVKAKMEQNSAAWFNASPDERQRLAAENNSLGASIGATKNANGDWVFPQGTRTLQGKQFDSNEAQRLWENTFKEGQFSYQKAADLWERTFKDKTFEQSVKQAAQGLGMDYSRMSQSQQQFAAEMAYKYKALEQSNQKNNEVETAEEYAKKYIDSLAKYDSYGTLVNGNALESQILTSGKSEAEMRKMYARYGLKWGD